MTRVLVINSGSSSLKLQIVDTAGETIATSLSERIGDSGSVVHVQAGDDGERRDRQVDLANHGEALSVVLELVAELGVHPRDLGVAIVGHRVVHGGSKFTQPTLVDDEVEAEIERLSELAPLHNPANLRGIQVAREMFPDLPHVAVFDTGFFSTLPASAYTYAVPPEWGIRRYGFHGTSHAYVSEQTAQVLGREDSDINQIVLHLGNGASASAVRGGVAVETSMGLTPLEGLVMGTRPGDVDPGALIHLMDERGVSPKELSEGLNRASGLKGLSGVSDFRELLERADGGDDAAKLAYDVTVHRLRKYVGAYWAVLGAVDAITFTAGIGENAPRLRADVLAGFTDWGVTVDAEANESGKGARLISGAGSKVSALVVPTNEELAIARFADEVVGAG